MKRQNDSECTKTVYQPVFISKCQHYLDQELPNWGTYTPKGAFRLFKEYITSKT